MSWSNEADYREALIQKRLERIDRIILFASGKGGVGKSLVSATSALILSKRGYRVGLLDLDLHGPSSSAIFGLSGPPVEAEEGLLPPGKLDVKVMSLDLFVEGRPLPFAGREKREIIREMLAMTRWGDLDVLVVDMPPETGDVLMEALRIFKTKAEAIVVTLPSILSMRVVARLVKILREFMVHIRGALVNMAWLETPSGVIEPYGPIPINDIKDMGIDFIGALPLDPDASRAADTGDLEKLVNSRLAQELTKILGI